MIGCLISLVVFAWFVAVYVWPFLLMVRAEMFVEAASRGDYRKMGLLLWLGVNVNGQSFRYGGTALHVAADDGDAKMVGFLIKKGARVNAIGGKGFPWTPLEIAVRRGHVKVAALLVANGAANPQVIFVHKRHLLDRDGQSENQWPVRGPVREDVYRLAEIARENINVRSDAGRTVLHAAATEGCEDCVELLTKSGADVDAKDSYGWTPLHLAAIDGHNAIVAFLIAEGADVNAKAAEAETPLHMAGSSAVAAVLIGNGAEINPKDKSGRTPLGMAQEKDRKAIATLLRKHGAKTGKELTD
ncbi:MAG: ankyrin repeat domain-containing protein [Planctomycetota bacterium]